MEEATRNIMSAMLLTQKSHEHDKSWADDDFLFWNKFQRNDVMGDGSLSSLIAGNTHHRGQQAASGCPWHHTRAIRFLMTIKRTRLLWGSQVKAEAISSAD